MYKFGEKTCPKCGDEVHGVEFVHGGDMTSIPHAGELKRTCTTCGYYWFISSLDNRENA